jgi:hypothetical protein
MSVNQMQQREVFFSASKKYHRPEAREPCDPVRHRSMERSSET